MARDAIRFNNTVFALVADHGHANLVEKPLRVLPATTSRFARKSAACGSAIRKSKTCGESRSFILYMNYPQMIEEAIADVAVVFGQGMNLYVYLRDPSGMLPETVARALLAMTMEVMPAAALVRTADGYQLLQRTRGPDPVDSPEARAFLSDQLDLPPADQDSEIDGFQLDAADGDAERALARGVTAAGRSRRYTGVPTLPERRRPRQGLRPEG